MNLRKYSRLKFGVVLAIGASIAMVLCVQCVRTYLYIDAVLVPQQAEREAERQVGALTTATRSTGITDPRALGPVIEHALESSSERVLWMRVLDSESNRLAQGGKPEGTAKVPPKWWERVEARESLGILADTTQGRAFVAMLPFRIPHTPHAPEMKAGERGQQARLYPASPGAETGSSPLHGDPHAGHRPPGYVVELAIPLRAVTGAFDGLRQNLIVGLIASVTLLVSLAIIALRARQYVRGKYLESELRLARRVQSDLYPKPHCVFPLMDFAASAVAADHVGGDFYDIFKAESGEIAIVLGDVSGKGVPAALLVSVLHGAIRSSTASEHEHACERINRMLCERTACERFATLFWGVFDPLTGTLRYVNAGHTAPMLIRHGCKQLDHEPSPFNSQATVQTIRLDEGGPALGVLANARYSAGTIQVEISDTLVVYSDGITEAADQKQEEFGEDRIRQMISEAAAVSPAELCERIMGQVKAFASAGAPPDDRTLLVVRFPLSATGVRQKKSDDLGVQAVA
jgi:serine phosphatase RsbU (regulator of sigma subunit)